MGTGTWAGLEAGPNTQWPLVFTKTTANGNWFFADAVALELGGNTITVAAVGFARTVKLQFSSPAIEFSSFAHNGEQLYPATAASTTTTTTGTWAGLEAGPNTQ